MNKDFLCGNRIFFFLRNVLCCVCVVGVSVFQKNFVSQAKLFVVFKQNKIFESKNKGSGRLLGVLFSQGTFLVKKMLQLGGL